MKSFFYGMIFFLLLANSIYSQYRPGGSFQDLRNSSVRYEDREAVIEQVEAYYIEMMLTRPMMESMQFTYGDEEDDQDSFASLSSQDGIIQDILAKELAKSLAEQDILGFKKLFKDQFDD